MEALLRNTCKASKGRNSKHDRMRLNVNKEKMNEEEKKKKKKKKN